MFEEMRKMGFPSMFQNPRYWDESYEPWNVGQRGWTETTRSIQQNSRGEDWRRKLSESHIRHWKKEHFGYSTGSFRLARHLIPTNGFWRHLESPLKEWRQRGNRNWRRSKIEYNRWARIKFLYNLSKEQFDQMLLQQNGNCAMCGKPPTGTWYQYGIPRSLEVDHNHTTGKVRALLCHHCNKVLGQYETWKESCENYLAKWA